MAAVLKVENYLSVLARVFGNYEAGYNSIFSANRDECALRSSELLPSQVELSVIDRNLNNGKEGEYDSKKGDYYGTISAEEFANTPYPRWLLLAVAFMFWLPGMFSVLYIGPFLFSENRAVCGILCVLAGLFLSFLALLLIHKAYLW